MSEELVPVRQLQEMMDNIEDIVRPLQMTNLVSNRVPKQVSVLNLPDKLPDKGIDMSDLMMEFEKEHLSNYNIVEENQFTSQSTVQSSTLEDMCTDSPISVPPAY